MAGFGRLLTRDLRDYREIGVKLVGSGGRLKYGEGRAVAVAKRLGKTRDYVEKACQLARLYDSKSFEVLLTHLQTTSNKHSFSLSLSHVMATLLLRTKPERKAFLKKAAENQWSADLLRAEIKSARKPKSQGGRKRRLPQTYAQVVHEALTVCRHLIGLRDTLKSHNLELPDDTWKALEAFNDAIDDSEH